MFRKPISSIVVIGFLFCIWLGNGEPTNAKEVDSSNNTALSEKKPSYSLSFLPGTDELSWRDGIGEALAVGGMIISGLVLLGGLAWLLAPIFGYRICSILGNCETTVLAHSNGGNLQDPVQTNSYPDMYNSVVTPYMSGYRKRSLKYVGPLLKTLASAYEKFDQQTSSSSKTD